MPETVTTIEDRTKTMPRKGRRLLDATHSPALVAAAMLIWQGCVEPTPSTVEPNGADRAIDNEAERRPAALISEPYSIAVTGRDYQWEIRYPGPDGELDTGDDVASVRDLRVPLDTDIALSLRSADYIYTLAFPEYGLREIAVPNLEFRMDLHAREVGRFELRGDQMCGYTHPQLLGELIVQPRAEFAEWIMARSAEGRTASMSPLTTGE